MCMDTTKSIFFFPSPRSREEVFVSKVVGGNVPVGFRRVHHLVAKGHVVGLLVFGSLHLRRFLQIFGSRRGVLREQPALRRGIARSEVGLWKLDV